MSDPDVMFREASDVLVDRVESAIPGWVRQAFLRHAPAAPPDLVDRTTDHMIDAVVPDLRRLLALDVDTQSDTPLALLRRSVPILSAALSGWTADARAVADPATSAPPNAPLVAAASVAPDRAADPFGLTPANWADLGDEDLATAGLVWGAAKAMAHLARHRPADR